MLTRLLFVVLALTLTPLAASRDFTNHHQPQPNEDRHWAIRLGSRVHAVDQTFPLIDRVVLVPDAATYLDEVARWSPQGRWPVLIEDDHFAPMFIRRFAPDEVIRREPIGEDTVSLHPNEIIVRAWGGELPRDSPEAAFALHQHEPAGLVISNPDDPAWLAAIALAAGRGQPIMHMTDDLGGPGSTISRERAAKIENEIRHELNVYGWPYDALGDTIETITICASIAGKVNLPRHDTSELEPAAITDFLGRNDDGSRYAFVGWIFGSETRSAYIAMSSLFLPRNAFTFVNGYPDDGPWQTWDVDPAGGLLSQRGFEVTVYGGNRANEDAWLRMIQSGIATDVLAVNTKGNVDFFDLSGDARMTAFDTPLLNQPTVVHFTHSWSMRLPATDTTIAARFLNAGAYGYVGSVHEPLLAAFVPPLPLAQRWASLVPVLIAARHWEAPQPFGGPWKVNTFGDPLMLALPAANGAKPRVESRAEYGTRLNDLVRETMRRVESDESGVAIADSIALLELLGRDEIAVQLWRHAQQRGLTSQVAGPALGPLFREGKLEEFLAAWGEGGMAGNVRALDMLWHKVTPEIARLRDDDVLLMLQGAIRRPHAQGDLARLAPHLSRAFGANHVRGVIQREIDRAENRRAKRALQQLLRRY